MPDLKTEYANSTKVSKYYPQKGKWLNPENKCNKVASYLS